MTGNQKSSSPSPGQAKIFESLVAEQAGHQEQDDIHDAEAEWIRDRDADVNAAYEFLDHMGMNNATPDMVEQLIDAFVPALRIMHGRGYDPYGGTWREGGWRSILQEMRKKTFRVWHNSWMHRRFDAENGIDGLNYFGYYVRLQCQGEPWGAWGEPDVGEQDAKSVQRSIQNTSPKMLP